MPEGFADILRQQPIHKKTYTGKNEKRSEQRPKERNCRYCNAPNETPKCPARESVCHDCEKKRHFAKVCRSERGKEQENEKFTRPAETEESDTDNLINILTEKKHVPDRKKIYFMMVKVEEKNSSWIPDTPQKIHETRALKKAEIFHA